MKKLICISVELLLKGFLQLKLRSQGSIFSVPVVVPVVSLLKARKIWTFLWIRLKEEIQKSLVLFLWLPAS